MKIEGDTWGIRVTDDTGQVCVRLGLDQVDRVLPAMVALHEIKFCELEEKIVALEKALAALNEASSSEGEAT